MLGILGEKRVNKELQTAKNLCEWLGYLPLGLELVGRYLQEDPDLSIAQMLEELKQERLKNLAIDPDSEKLAETEITAKLGVQAAFNLTWERLDSKTKEVGELLSLFDPNAIAWKYVESVTESLNWSKTDVREGKKQLYQRHLIKRLEEGEANYQIHPLIHEFLGSKLQASTQTQEQDLPTDNVNTVIATKVSAAFPQGNSNPKPLEVNNECVSPKELEQAFTSTFIEVAQKIPDVTTLEIINSLQNAIPHLTQVAKNHLDGLDSTNLFRVFIGLEWFYYGQGLYTLAQPWYEQCVSELKSHLGENHIDYASSLNNLAELYREQGKYVEAEPLYIQALEIKKLQLGVNHPSTAPTLNNLAILYKNQGKYDQAEPLYIQALEIKKLQLGVNHPDTATSLNNLAELYREQGKYVEAEPLYIQALEIRKQQLGENHPNTASSLNNLANLYSNQGKYLQAERLHIQALEIRKLQLGVNHPDTATSLNNLAILYWNQGKYLQAEPLYIQALEIVERVLGSDHPHTKMYRRNLENLRAKQREVPPQQQQTSKNDSWFGKLKKQFLG